jgi:hypothetical protein
MSSQFFVYYSGFFGVCFFFCLAGVSLSRGLCWFIAGVAVGVPVPLNLFNCWSVSPKQIWSWHLAALEPSWFLSVTWYGEAFCGLGVCDVRFLLLFGGVFLPSVAPVFQQDFLFTELTSHHLGSPPRYVSFNFHVH